MAKILVTGFEPFDGFDINPSEEVAKAVNGKEIDQHSIVGLVLPLDYKNALKSYDLQFDLRECWMGQHNFRSHSKTGLS